jgi:hypothetical protein
LGSILVVAGSLLALARRAVIGRVTSRSLGSLAPGWAATDHGYLVYAFLVVDLGLLVLALGFGSVALIAAAALAFILGSIAVLIGEVVVFRRLKR